LIAALTAMTVIPVYLIMPFKTQTPRALDIAFNLKHWAPLATTVGLLALIALTVYMWRGGRWRWLKRVVLILVLALAGVFTWFARQNHFEWMFNPLPHPAFAKASDATAVADTDQVMVVTINNESAAYPIREMAYHHVVEDTVGGVPIVATY
jgi:hypothetical protein